MRTICSIPEYAVPPSPGRVEPAAAVVEDFPLTVVAPAFLLSELTTALMIGFFVYLPFLVIDLVVSSVLAAIGLFMLPADPGGDAAEADRVRAGRRLDAGGDDAAGKLFHRAGRPLT